MRFRGPPPGGVDVTVRPVDWIDGIGPLKAEIAQEDHVHGGWPSRGSGHDHRSLWFVDPFGIESLDHAAAPHRALRSSRRMGRAPGDRGLRDECLSPPVVGTPH